MIKKIFFFLMKNPFERNIERNNILGHLFYIMNSSSSPKKNVFTLSSISIKYQSISVCHAEDRWYV